MLLNLNFVLCEQGVPGKLLSRSSRAESTCKTGGALFQCNKECDSLLLCDGATVISTTKCGTSTPFCVPPTTGNARCEATANTTLCKPQSSAKCTGVGYFPG